MRLLQVLTPLLLGFMTISWARGSEDVDFRLRNNFLIVIDGSIGSIEGLSLLVDTGATRSVVDRTIVEKLRGAFTHSNVFIGGERRLTPEAEIDDLKFGPIWIRKLTVFAMDLSPLSKMAGTPIQAIIGLDVLRLQSLEIDYRHKKLHFGRSNFLRYSATFHPDSPYLLVTASIDGAAVRVMVDTGADRLSLFRHRLPSSLQSHTLLPACRRTASGSVKGASLIRDANLKLGSFRLPDSLVFVLPSEKDFVAFDGHLGTGVLGAKVISFDFENGKLWWNN